MKRILYLLLLCLLLAGSGPVVLAQANEEKPAKLTLNGYTKFLHSTSIADAPGFPLTSNFLHNRLNFRWYATEHFTLAVEMRNRFFWGEQVKVVPNFGDQIDQYDGLVDLSVRWAEGDAFLFHSVLDRFYGQYSHGKWELRLGRQRVNWGLNTVWNPNDLFNAFNYLDFDYEERPGSDAIRVTYYPKILTSIELAFAPSRDSIGASTGALKYKFNSKGYDIQLLSGYYRGDLALGGGWAGSIGGMGFKGEGTYFVPLAAATDSLNRLSASVSAEYMFGVGSGLFAIASVLYNGSASTQNLDLQNPLFGGAPSPKNLFPSTWTFFLSGSGSVTPLLNVNGSLFYAPDNHLTGLIPTVTYSIVENWDMDLVGQIFFAQNAQGRFGHASSGIFFRLKQSF